MTATSQPTLPSMRDVAATLSEGARENLAGVDNVGPLFAERAQGGVQCSVVAIVADRTGKARLRGSHMATSGKDDGKDDGERLMCWALTACRVFPSAVWGAEERLQPARWPWVTVALQADR
jgi:hypothetical protein